MTGAEVSARVEVDGRGCPRTLIIIPAYNEQQALPSVLSELAQTTPRYDVLVVDDGSTDKTAELARAAGVNVVQLPFNLGVGAALRVGFRFAFNRSYERAVQIDADGQHDVAEIATLLTALDAGADMVIGSRFAPASTDMTSQPYKVGHLRRAAMGLLRVAVRLLCGQRFTDTTSGFRAFSAPVLELFSRNYPAEFMSDTVEALVLACNAGYRVSEVPTPMRVRAGGTPSTRSVRLVYNYIRVLLGLMISVGLRRQPQPDSRP